MDKLIAAVARRINPGGVKELTIRQYGAEQLEVIIPEVEQARSRPDQEANLRPAVCSNSASWPTKPTTRDIIRAGKKTAGTDVYLGGKLVGRWVKLGPNFTRPQRGAAATSARPDGAGKCWCGSTPSTSTAAISTVRRRASTRGGTIVEFTFDSDRGPEVSDN